jgi:hypothetical protein
VKFSIRNPVLGLGLVVLWRLALLVFTAQPVPANDAFFYDGPVVNWLLHGHYCNPPIGDLFPISRSEVFSAYPPLYQAGLLCWMTLFGTSVISAMAFHVALFAVAGGVMIFILKKYFPAANGLALAPLLLLAFTFDDRPDAQAHLFGLLAIFLALKCLNEPTAWQSAALLVFALLGALFSACVTGALYFGAGFLMLLLAWRRGAGVGMFLPFFAAAGIFFCVVLAIAKLEPRWWAGFMENASQQTVASVGLRIPQLGDLLKLVRTLPVFVLALFLLPLLVLRWRDLCPRRESWLVLTAGIFVLGWGAIVADLTLLSPQYVGQLVYLQVLLAAGLLALLPEMSPRRPKSFCVPVLAACVLLISIRAVGMCTWGAVCAVKNSRSDSEAIVRRELLASSASPAPVLVSSAYLYSAATVAVTNVVYADWYFDHAHWTNNADVIGLMRVRPQKLVLTQFDFYRSFAVPLEKLRLRPGVVVIAVRDATRVRTPDSMPSLQRVVQHISWAPVVVDLQWTPLD